MSYPPPQQPGGNPPYPPNYQSYPGSSPSYGFSPQVTQAGYTPYPTGPTNAPYPQAGGGITYPTASWGSSGSLPYPPQPGGPPAPGYPSQSAPYPGAPQSSYPSYPGAPGSSYPSAPSGQPGSSYPPATGYPGAPGGTYPPPSAGGYPPPSTGGYPPTSGPPTSGYPASGGYPSASGTPATYPPQGSYPGYDQSQYTRPSGGQHTHSGHQTRPGMASSPTVSEYHPFNPDEDAKTLRKAMKGFGTDEKAIIDVLANRTNAQRQAIYLAYKTNFGRDLISDLKSELSGRFEDAIVALMVPTADYLAGQLHKAIAGIGTKESTLIEVLCSRTNQEIREINDAYIRLYKRPLERHLIEDTSGHFRKLLVSLSMGNRNENPNVDHGRAAEDAKALYQAGAAQWGTDESVFNSILVAQSFGHLREVINEYQRLTNKSIETAIKNEFSGDVEDGLLAIVKCARNTPAYFAERLHHSMAGAGTNDEALIRIIVTRCEVDMGAIKQEFQSMYGKALSSFIAGDTSGDYKKVLLALVK